jgi:uncharacterized protein (TIGR02284 family)
MMRRATQAANGGTRRRVSVACRRVIDRRRRIGPRRSVPARNKTGPGARSDHESEMQTELQMTAKTKALETLLTRLVDSRDGYKEALDHVSNPSLKATMVEFHQRRERNAEELRGYLTRSGVSVDDDGSLLASAHRTWMGLKDSVTGSDDKSTLQEIVRGEKTLLNSYDDALTEVGAADPEFGFLAEQHASLKQAIAQLETRKDLAA